MLHYFNWQIVDFQDFKVLKNDFFGIKIVYNGQKKEGTFFVFPYMDQNIHSIIYFTFDNIQQLKLFEKLYKLPWIGPRTAYNISFIPQDKLKQAVDNVDINFFKQIPWIGPKTAKRIIVELKSQVTSNDLKIDDALWKKIKNTFKNLGYSTDKIEQILKKCDIPLKEENLQEIVKYILDRIW